MTLYFGIFWSLAKSDQIPLERGAFGAKTKNARSFLRAKDISIQQVSDITLKTNMGPKNHPIFQSGTSSDLSTSMTLGSKCLGFQGVNLIGLTLGFRFRELESWRAAHHKIYGFSPETNDARNLKRPTWKRRKHLQTINFLGLHASMLGFRGVNTA